MIRNCILALFITAFALACATTDKPVNPSQAESVYRIGVAYLQENKIQRAFVEFQKAYEMDPRNKDVLNGIGVIYLLHFDEDEKAAEFFQKAVSVDPQFSEAYNNLGVVYEKKGEYEKAVETYRKALSNLTYATPEKAFVNMGNCYYRMKKYDLAIRSYQEALKRDSKLSIAYMRLALALNMASKFGDAAEAMNKAIAYDPAYRGSREAAVRDLREKRLTASGPDWQDITDYLEILKY